MTSVEFEAKSINNKKISHSKLSNSLKSNLSVVLRKDMKRNKDLRPVLDYRKLKRHRTKSAPRLDSGSNKNIISYTKT